MPWNQVTVDIPHELLDEVTGELGECGVAGIWETAAPLPGTTRLVFYCDSAAGMEDAEARIRSIFSHSSRALPEFAREAVVERDWGEEWKKTWTSFSIGKGFFVIPSWSADACPAGRRAIRIDPGQAFGTGTHETTQLTLEALERRLRSHAAVLDVGTGSGILAIAARLLGAQRVFACDVDPEAVRVAAENFQRNTEGSTGEAVRIFCGSADAVSGHSIDIALCNLTADVILDLLLEIRRVVKPGGLAILSGILVEQGPSIREACDRLEFTIHEETTRGAWLGFVVQNRGS